MNTNKHFPLSKPPQVSEERVAIPTPAVAQITQKRMTLLKRANKLFFVFGLLSLAAGIYSYLEWQKDSKELARYEKIFDRFPQSSTIEVKNSSQADLIIGSLEVFYTTNNKDSIEMFSSEKKVRVKSGGMHEFTIKEHQKSSNETNLLFYAIIAKEDDEDGALLSITRQCPKNHIIELGL